jgi:hypothetical protein
LIEVAVAVVVAGDARRNHEVVFLLGKCKCKVVNSLKNAHASYESVSVGVGDIFEFVAARGAQ